jgi:hypothetical protein
MVAAAALLLVLALAACGGSGSSGGNGSASTEAGTAEGAPASGSAGAGRSRTATAKPEAGATSPGSGKSATSSSGGAGTEGAPASEPTSKSSTADAPEAAVTPQAAGATKAAPARFPARRRARPARRRLVGKAGAAAPFLVAQGDNSIPTYGSEASPGQLAAAEAVLSGYLGARASGDWAGACSLMSASVRGQIAVLAGESSGGRSSCAAAYAKLSERIPASERADPLVAGLTALRVESPHAFALFYGPGSQQYMMPLEEEGGDWRVTQIAAVPWPIGSQAHGR